MNGKFSITIRRMRSGFSLVEIMIVVAIIAVFIAIAAPGFIRAREVSRRNSCQENLTKIDAAKATWALENNKAGTDTPTWGDLIIDQESYLRFKPICRMDPEKNGSTYDILPVNQVPTCDQGEGEFSHIFPVPGAANLPSGS